MPSNKERRCQKYACALQDCLAKQRHIAEDPVKICRIYFESHQQCMDDARREMRSDTSIQK